MVLCREVSGFGLGFVSFEHESCYFRYLELLKRGRCYFSLSFHPLKTPSESIFASQSRFCQSHCTLPLAVPSTPLSSSISHSSIIHSLYAHISNSIQFVNFSHVLSPPSLQPSSPSWEIPLQPSNHPSIRTHIRPSLSQHHNTAGTESAEDKNKGVVDRSSTVVARDVLERAAAANEGN